MKKIILFLLCYCIFLQTGVLAKSSYTAQLNKGAKQLSQQKYTLAIETYTKIIKQAPDNLQARIGLTEAYITRANVYYNKNKEFGKAANDYRNALYYIQYFKPVLTDDKLEKLAFEAENKLNKCYKKLHFKTHPEGHFLMAELLGIARIYPAAIYEFSQASKEKDFAASCNNHIKELLKNIP